MGVVVKGSNLQTNGKIFIGNSKISKIYLGSIQIHGKIYAMWQGHTDVSWENLNGFSWDIVKQDNNITTQDTFGFVGNIFL